MEGENMRASWGQCCCVENVEWYVDLSILCKVHIDSCRDNSIVPSIFPITPVVWSPSLDIVSNALEPPNLVPFVRATSRGPSGLSRDLCCKTFNLFWIGA